MTHSQKHRNCSGFTLIELLVAMAIMSAILAAIYNTFLLAHRALSAVDQSTVKLQEARAFLDILTREIESTHYFEDNVYCLFKIDDRDFYGRQASTLTLTTSSPLLKGLARINYTVEEKDGILAVTKSMNSAFSKAGGDNRIDLLDDIESFELQAKYGDQWVKTWDSALTRNVPEEVRIALTIRIKKSGEEAASAALFSMAETVKLKVGSPL
jgi:general secretion pathway protein J